MSNDISENVKQNSFEPKKVNNQLDIVLVFDFEIFNDAANAISLADVLFLFLT